MLVIFSIFADTVSGRQLRVSLLARELTVCGLTGACGRSACAGT